jgi:DNA-binding LacI/PurR family transcriptional regulator
MARPGIQDVAAAAGVSTTTVSHALNGKGRLSPATRERVRDVAAALGYRPSALARRLSGGEVGMLALTVSLVNDEALAVSHFDYFLQLMHGATSAALERGYSLAVLPARRGDTLDRLPLDGTLVVDPVRADQVVARMHAKRVPVVTTGRLPGGPEDSCWVDNDFGDGTRAILDHLADQGCERVALLATPPVSSYAIDTLAAYGAWCASSGRPRCVATIRETPIEGAAFAVAADLLTGPEPPDGIYATLDRLALGALLAAKANGVSVPDDLRIAGCSDSEGARTARPPLTALSLNPEVIGEQAVDLLVALIEGDEPAERRRFVASAIVPRESTVGEAAHPAAAKRSLPS